MVERVKCQICGSLIPVGLSESGYISRLKDLPEDMTENTLIEAGSLEIGGCF
jgi:hypothetical protein